MGPDPGRRRRHALLPTLLLSSLVVAIPTTVSAAETPASNSDDLGCGSAEVTRTLATGSAWRMCARIHPFKGLVLEDVQFRPATGDREYAGWMPVLDSLYLAQLNVPYDTATAAFNDITSYGFGDDQLLSQTSETCGGETMDVEQSFMRGSVLVERTVPGICLDEVGTGLGWHSQEGYANSGDAYEQRGSGLEVSSLSKVSWYEYQQTITLSDQGTVTVGLGATGDLAPGQLFFPTDPTVGWPVGPAADGEQRHGASHWHNATYRVDFGIGTGPQQVEQWDYEQPNPGKPALLRGTGTVRDRAFTAADPDPTTWWRVVNPTSLNPDGHPRSYEIVNDATTDPYLPLTRPVVSFTNDHSCQEYASMNLNAECPGASVADYVAAETDPLTDPVAWVNVGFHHVDRDEDQSPMPVHWQSFSLVPRDFLAQQATTPRERSCDNGMTLGRTGSCAAINTSPPTITAEAPSAGPPAPGTLLTATTGSWRHARAPLTYLSLWLRDGQPIVTVGPDGLPAAVTGARYRATELDSGHTISVQVTASATGVTPGSATSAPVTISSDQPASAPGTTTARARPTLRLHLTGGRADRPRLRIVVRGGLGPVTGRVRIQTDGDRGVARRLGQGRATVTLRRPHAGRARVVVRFLGSQLYLETTATVWLPARAPRSALLEGGTP